MNKRYLLILIIIAILLSIANSLTLVRQTVSAARLAAPSIPQVISYQGRLTDAAGNPLTGDYDMRFCLYGEPAGGSALWCEQAAVSVSYGVFSVLLGSITSIPQELFDEPDLFLGVKIGSDDEMIPRRRIVSVGYAYRAEIALDADTVDDMHASDFASTSHTHPEITGISSGLIAVFDGPSCPSGWTRVAELDGKFLVGGPSYNASAGGSNTHTHGAGSYRGSSHTHTIDTHIGTPIRRGNSHYLGVTTDHGGGPWGDQYEKNRYGTSSETLTTSASEGGAVSGTSAPADARPEFATVLLCKKD